MSTRCMIYGATGYTGQLIARRAKQQGLSPILAGRNPTKLQALGDAVGSEHRVFSLADRNTLLVTLSDVAVVLNAAGPFSATALPLADACLRTGTHYLDIAGEIPVFEDLYSRDAEAKARQIMLMPGVGFAVVPSDCLATHVARRLPTARHLRIGLSRLHLMSRGSAKTMIELVNQGSCIRRNGRLHAIRPGQFVHEFDFGSGNQPCVAIAWADVFTAFHTTGIPNIEVYVEVDPLERTAMQVSGCFGPLLSTFPWQRSLKMQTELLSDGPSEAERARCQQVIIAEAENVNETRVRARLHTPNTYTFTVMTALQVITEVLAGNWQAGFHTPAQVYDANFIRRFGEVKLEDLAS